MAQFIQHVDEIGGKMAKLLNLNLTYKGKMLDRALQGRDFHKKFYIGSNKYLYWQILDPNFPDKHLFITEKGNQYYMQLSPGAKVTCNVDGKPVESAYLNQNNLLSGTELKLSQNTSGTISVSPDYQISYEYREPWERVLTPEEKQIVAQYARMAEIPAQLRFNRNLILLFVFLTLIFVLILDLVIKPNLTVTVDSSLQQKLATLKKAELIKAQVAMDNKGSTFEQENTGEGEKEAVEPTKEQGSPTGTATGTGAGTSRSASSMFGIGNFDPNATSTGTPIRIVTTSEGFVAARPGRGGGGGGGSGPGGGGSGTGGGFGGSFDPNAPRTFSSDIGQTVTNAPRVGGSSVRPSEGTFVNVAGDQSKLAPSGVVFGQTAKMTTALQTFRAKKIQEVREGTVSESMAPQAKTNYENIAAAVNARKGQLQQAYSKWNATIPFTGSVTISLLIKASGAVESAAVTPNGQMPSGFLQEVKSLCEGWRFNVTEDSWYTFKTSFRKS